MTEPIDPCTFGIGMRVVGSSTPVSGTVTATPTAGTALILGTQACNQLWVTAPASNSVAVVVGTSISNLPISMAPGTTHVFPVTNANLLFCKSSTSSATEVLQWMAL